jgi:endonuclease/exonuclease/phosphatase (EEP) superfamily protein YafD
MDSWIVDIFSHFSVQYAFVSLILFFVCLRKKSYFIALFVAALTIFNASVIVSPGRTVHAAGHDGTVFTVYSANVNKRNINLSRLRLELQKRSPDIVLLLEMTPQHVEEARPLKQVYPYSIEKLQIDKNGSGFTLLSKFPILGHHLTKLSEYGNAIIAATIEINHKELMFYGTHAQRPRKGNFNERKEQLMSLAREIQTQPRPVIVFGDLNSTALSPIFRQLMKISGLRDSRAGFGWLPTWPTYFPFLWVPIDHILISPEVSVHMRAVGTHIGSDHYPVFAELSIS